MKKIEKVQVEATEGALIAHNTNHNGSLNSAAAVLLAVFFGKDTVSAIYAWYKSLGIIVLGVQSAVASLFSWRVDHNGTTCYIEYLVAEDGILKLTSFGMDWVQGSIIRNDEVYFGTTKQVKDRQGRKSLNVSDLMALRATSNHPVVIGKVYKKMVPGEQAQQSASALSVPLPSQQASCLLLGQSYVIAAVVTPVKPGDAEYIKTVIGMLNLIGCASIGLEIKLDIDESQPVPAPAVKHAQGKTVIASPVIPLIQKDEHFVGKKYNVIIWKGNGLAEQYWYDDVSKTLEGVWHTDFFVPSGDKVFRGNFKKFSNFIKAGEYAADLQPMINWYNEELRGLLNTNPGMRPSAHVMNKLIDDFQRKAFCVREKYRSWMI